MNEGHAQTQWQESTNAEEFRTTVELGQVILNYFHPTKEPVGIPGLTIVVAGKHCRLSNISERGTWRRTAEFWIGKKHVVQMEGTARQHMPESGYGIPHARTKSQTQAPP